MDQECNKYVFSILRVTYFMTSLLAVFEAAKRLKSTHLINSCLKTRKKTNMEIKDIFT